MVGRVVRSEINPPTGCVRQRGLGSRRGQDRCRMKSRGPIAAGEEKLCTTTKPCATIDPSGMRNLRRMACSEREPLAPQRLGDVLRALRPSGPSPGSASKGREQRAASVRSSVAGRRFPIEPRHAHSPWTIGLGSTSHGKWSWVIQRSLAIGEPDHEGPVVDLDVEVVLNSKRCLSCFHLQNVNKITLNYSFPDDLRQSPEVDAIPRTEPRNP